MNEHFEIFKDIDVSISTEEYVSVYNKKLTEHLTKLVEKVRKDKELNLTNEQYFVVNSYKEIFNNIEKDINKLFNINLRIVPNDKLAIYLEQEDKATTNKIISSAIKGKKIDVDKSLKEIEYSYSKIHGKKFKTPVNMYLGININDLVFVDKLEPSEISKLILDIINSLYKAENKKNTLIKTTKNIVNSLREGASLDDIYSKYIDSSTSISEYDDKKKVIAIMNGFVLKATEDTETNNDDKDKLHILIRINYLIMLIILLIIIFTAISKTVLSVKILGISIVTLLVYNILIYLYKLGVMIFTGNRDPLNEGFTNKEVSSLIEKDKSMQIIRNIVKDKFKPSMFRGREDDFSIDNISKFSKV